MKLLIAGGDARAAHAACEAARTRYDYTKLSDLLGEWQAEAQARFEAEHGNR